MVYLNFVVVDGVPNGTTLCTMPAQYAPKGNTMISNLYDGRQDVQIVTYTEGTIKEYHSTTQASACGQAINGVYFY